MKIQVSRDRFRPDDRYSGVYQQQGRMITDSDWNEMVDIVTTMLRSGTADAVGSGSPAEGGILGPDRRLRAGTAYVDGLRAELTATGSSGDLYLRQSDFPSPPARPTSAHRLYLDVWERTVVSLEDTGLLDPALHGADTTARTQTMAQLKWAPDGVDLTDEDVNPSRGNGSLTASLRGGSTFADDGGDADPCDPCATRIPAGTTATGNYLFRLEVHDVGLTGTGENRKVGRIVLKWSSENAAEQYDRMPWPPDFDGPAWAYETFDDTAEKQLGWHLSAFVPQRGALATEAPDTLATGSRVRRWDGFCELRLETPSVGPARWVLATATAPRAAADRGVRLVPNSPVGAAHGNVDVRTSEGGPAVTMNLHALTVDLDLGGGRVVPGDYWLVLVRERDTEHVRVLSPLPTGVVHHYLPLGAEDATGALVLDAAAVRRLGFPALTDLGAEDVGYARAGCAGLGGVTTVGGALDRTTALTRLSVLGGGGQDGLPGSAVAPLRVLVANDCGPVPGAQVRFEVVSGGGALQGAGGPVTRPADASGVAECSWRLGAVPQQHVRATLVDAVGNPVGHPATADFHATASVAAQVAYDPAAVPMLAGAVTVQSALDRLGVRRPTHCTVTAFPGDDLQAAVESLPAGGGLLCLAAGVYDLPKPLHVTGRSRVRLVGCGSSTVLRTGHEVVVVFRDCHDIEVADLRVESGGMGTAPGEQHLMGALTFLGCTDVRVHDCELTCRASLGGRGQACLAIHSAGGTPDQTVVAGNRLEVGSHQVGVLVVGPPSLTVRDNRILVSQLPAPGATPLPGIGAAPMEQGIVVGGAAAGTVHVTGNTVEGAVQGIHVGASSRDASGEIKEVLIDANTVLSVVPSFRSHERHAVYVANGASVTVTNTHATCVRPDPAPGATPVDAIRLVGNLGPFIRVSGATVHGFAVGVRVEPFSDPGAAGMNSRMWFVGDILTVGAGSPVVLSAAVRQGIVANA